MQYQLNVSHQVVAEAHSRGSDLSGSRRKALAEVIVTISEYGYEAEDLINAAYVNYYDSVSEEEIVEDQDWAAFVESSNSQ